MNIKTNNFLQVTNPNIRTNVSNPAFVGIFSKNKDANVDSKKDVKKDEFVKKAPKEISVKQKILYGVAAAGTTVAGIFGIKKLKSPKNIDTDGLKKAGQKLKPIVEGTTTAKPKSVDVDSKNPVVEPNPKTPQTPKSEAQQPKPEDTPRKTDVESVKPEVQTPKPPKVKEVPMTLDEVFEKYPPRNYDLAQEIYPVLHKNAETLGLKPEHYEEILSNINKNNKEFMKTEGFDLIASNMPKLRDILTESEANKEIGSIVSSLDVENKNVFARVLNDPETFKVDFVEDLVTYLKFLRPKNEKYTFEKALPLLEKYEKDLRLVDAERFSLALNSMNADIEDIVPLLAKENSFPNLKKYRMLMNTTKNNKECLIPLIQNMAKFGLDSENAAVTLKHLNNFQKKSIIAVADNIAKLDELKLDKLDVLTRLNTEDSSKIFNRIINNAGKYKLKEASDVSYFVEKFEGKDLDFIENDVLPKLKEYAEPLRIKYAEDIAEIAGNLTPKTLDNVEIVAQYAQKYGNNVNYIALLGGLTEDNAKNLTKVLDNIERTGLWDDVLVCSEDFKYLLDKGL
ncbi:MAG: hypothetical protein E7Z87_05210 [Cyanobacteria bacterium SIG26]|nr:hypothetical protein [Cyanobacteria bacterium SIG26]